MHPDIHLMNTAISFVINSLFLCTLFIIIMCSEGVKPDLWLVYLHSGRLIVYGLGSDGSQSR